MRPGSFALFSTFTQRQAIVTLAPGLHRPILLTTAVRRGQFHLADALAKFQETFTKPERLGLTKRRWPSGWSSIESRIIRYESGEIPIPKAVDMTFKMIEDPLDTISAHGGEK